MKEHYVSYECAVALKRLGFDWDVRGYYTRDDNFQKVREITALNHNDTQFKGLYSAPRLDQAAAWLREVKGIHVEPCFQYGVIFKVVVQSETKYLYKILDKGYKSYESALSAGIDKALELLGKEVKE